VPLEQKKKQFVAKHTHIHNNSAAAAIQSFIRGYFVRRWHKQMVQSGNYNTNFQFGRSMQANVTTGGGGGGGGGIVDNYYNSNQNYDDDSLNSPLLGYDENNVGDGGELVAGSSSTVGVFEKLYDESAQAWYWYNEVTGEASWTDPSQD
jgi:hypothetical protein